MNTLLTQLEKFSFDKVKNPPYHPLRELPPKSPFKKGDCLVLFGELFARGYANGLVEAAEQVGMKIIYATVGRREKNDRGEEILRPLNTEELASKPQPTINVPLEAGFDLEPSSQGVTPAAQMKDVKLSEWSQVKIDFAQIEESRLKGEERFRKNTTEFLKQLEAHIPAGANVLFAHLMAGGVPRTKIVMPLMNRICKGEGDRYLSSLEFWNSDIGRVCAMSFDSVTAHTFYHLLDLSTSLREKWRAEGRQVSYVAYGYHGTEIFFNNKYQWQCYAPYIQGWAKMKLENMADHFMRQGVSACVYNCPEILTNSSSIFQGVEIPLYRLILALKKEKSSSSAVQNLIDQCRLLLNQPEDLEKIFDRIESLLNESEIKDQNHYEKWPMHSSKTQLGKMLQASDEIISFHKDPKNLMTGTLSEVIFKSCGYVMLHDGYQAKAPSAWLNHDICARGF